MALTNAQLDRLRETFRRNLARPDLTKQQVNAAFQAIEARMTAAATRNAVAADIEAAAPGAFSAQEKATLFGCWCDGAAQRLGVN